MDNIINISGFNANGEALDGNLNRIIIRNNLTDHVLKVTNEIGTPDKVVAVINVIND